MVKKRKRKESPSGNNESSKRTTERRNFSSSQVLEVNSELDNVIGIDDSTSKSEKIDSGSELQEETTNIVQQWLDEKYLEGRKEEITEIDTKDWGSEEKFLKGKIKFEGFDNLERIIFSKEVIKNIEEIEIGGLPNLKLVGFNLSFNDEPEIQGIRIIKLKDLPNLKTFLANHCKVEEIEIENCPELVDFRVGNNLLTNLDFLSNLNPKKINVLSVHSNNLGEKEMLGLEYFNKFENLERLFIDNASKSKIEKGVYNRFSGSLEPLRSLTKLKELNISNTDIDSELGELENLLDSLKNLEEISCSSDKTPNSGVKSLAEKLKNLSEKKHWYFEEKNKKFNRSRIKEWEDIGLDSDNKKQWKDEGFSPQQVSEWIKVGLNLGDAGFASFLEKNGFNVMKWRSPFELTKKKELMEKYKYREKWKERRVQEWLDKEYPVDKVCVGIFDSENKGKERKDIEELDISSKELEGELRLEGFTKLKYLVCNNNKLTKIDLTGCLKLIGIDCAKNELKMLTFNNEEGKKLNLKEFRGSENKFFNLKGITDHINSDTLAYFNINNNSISGTELSEFDWFSNLENLYIGNTEKKGRESDNESNHFTGQLKELKSLKKLLEVDIRNNNGIEIKESFLSLKKDKKLLGKLEKIYSNELGKEQLENLVIEDEKSQQEFLPNLGEHYSKEDSFYDVKGWRQGKVQNVKSIVKIPLLSGDKDRYLIHRISEDYSNSKEIYYSMARSIYPSEEAEFSWNFGKSIPMGKLPLRLCYIKSDGSIEVKKRIECANDMENYAILSYNWGGKPKEELKWSLESAEKRLNMGAAKSFKKITSALKILRNFYGLDIKYFWMDQLCMDQDNEEEKRQEYVRLGNYYSSSKVTLVAIHADVGEENIRRLIKSFERGENGFIQPNKVVENSLPILEKIIGSDWFSRTWTFQEGFLSKQTIFMFDDFLIDGRFMALIWKLRQASKTYYGECASMKVLCGEKVATPVGWVYYEYRGEKGYGYDDKTSLRLDEALFAVKRREKRTPLDGIYSVVGLLPYGHKVKVDDQEKDPELVLCEIMLIAASNGYGELLSWHGSGSKTPGLCWVPEIDDFSMSNRITGTININYRKNSDRLNGWLFNPNEGIKIKGSEYVIVGKDIDINNFDREETVEGGLWQIKIWVKVGKGKIEKRERLTLSGTKEGIKAVGEGRMLLIPNSEEWESDIPFAILALKTKKVGESNSYTNIYHRIDLLRIEKGIENLLRVEEKELIIGQDSQRYQVQIEVPPK